MSPIPGTANESSLVRPSLVYAALQPAPHRARLIVIGLLSACVAAGGGGASSAARQMYRTTTTATFEQQPAIGVNGKAFSVLLPSQSITTPVN